MTGVMIYGEVTSERLRDVSVQKIQLVTGPEAARLGVRWSVEPPPEAWAWDTALHSSTATKGMVDTRDYSASEVSEFVLAEASRREGESADDYYARFALAYQRVTYLVSKPSEAVAVISEALGEDPNTIYQYIHRARKRGFLPPTRRSAK